MRAASATPDVHSIGVFIHDVAKHEYISIDCGVATELEEGDIIAAVEVPKGGPVVRQQEAWILREMQEQVYEIIACGQLRNALGEIFGLPPVCTGMKNPSANYECLTQEEHDGMSRLRRMELEAHLDPEDVLAYAAINSGVGFHNVDNFKLQRMRKSYVTGDRRFGRARFSSFATLRPHGQSADDDMKVCVHCGTDLRSGVVQA